MIWCENADRIPDGWRLKLTDFSDGMLQAARTSLGDRAQYAVADVQALPFEAESFDAVIANHMLFHVEDRPRAFSELRRVLRPRGSFVGTTIGREHLRELRELAPPRNGIWAKTWERFAIETAEAELAPFFAEVELERYPDSLEVTDAEAIVEVVRSNGHEPADRLAEIRAKVETLIAGAGSFHVSKDTARFRCRKP
jgi:ubiquinone/menaquinone biosynthesis C-methylase UbiE